MNTNTKRNLVEILESERPFREFTAQFKNLDEAYIFYAQYAQSKCREEGSRGLNYVLHWRKIYSNADSYGSFFANLLLGRYVVKSQHFTFQTIHSFDKKIPRQLLFFGIVRKLLSGLAFLLAIITGVILIVTVMTVIGIVANSGSASAAVLLVVGIILVLVAPGLIFVIMALQKKSLTLGMPQEIKSIGRGVFELTKVRKIRT